MWRMFIIQYISNVVYIILCIKTTEAPNIHRHTALRPLIRESKKYTKGVMYII